MLLTREAFREAVFKRDKHLCVACGKAAADAHHIMERRLFNDGGYYLSNGAALCAEHHMQAEMTKISPYNIRKMAGITGEILPGHLYTDQEYDKWGNPILPNGQRTRGELFDDPSVQKILKAGGCLELFTNLVKYPKTYHLPWSLGLTKGDRIHQDENIFEGQDVVVTLKMDGENTTMYSNDIHARSVDSGSHPSRDRVKALHAEIAYNIPENWRVCGENLFAKHSIQYTSLPSYFLMFSIWNDANMCMSWDDTEEWAELLGLHTVKTFYRGKFDKAMIHKKFKELYGEVNHEGYVVRLSRSFHYSQFRHSVGKYVRKNHVTTDSHWMREQVVPNEVAIYVDDLDI